MTNKQELDYLKVNLKVLIDRWKNIQYYSSNSSCGECAEQLQELLDKIEEMKLWG